MHARHPSAPSQRNDASNFSRKRIVSVPAPTTTPKKVRFSAGNETRTSAPASSINPQRSSSTTTNPAQRRLTRFLSVGCTSLRAPITPTAKTWFDSIERKGWWDETILRLSGNADEQNDRELAGGAQGWDMRQPFEDPKTAVDDWDYFFYIFSIETFKSSHWENWN